MVSTYIKRFNAENIDIGEHFGVWLAFCDKVTEHNLTVQSQLKPYVLDHVCHAVFLLAVKSITGDVVKQVPTTFRHSTFQACLARSVRLAMGFLRSLMRCDTWLWSIVMFVKNSQIDEVSDDARVSNIV